MKILLIGFAFAVAAFGQCGTNGHIGPIGGGQKSCIYPATAPVTVTFDTTGGTCSPGCTASATSGTGSRPGIVVNHNLGLPASVNPTAICSFASAQLGGLSSAANPVVDIVTAVGGNQTTITFGAAVTGGSGGNCRISTGSIGPTGASYTATSTTSLVTAASGSKSFTTQSGLAYVVGARIRATSAGTAEYMEGVVTSYSGSTLVATMDHASGSGTHTDWNLNVVGDVGAQGPAGTGSGDMLKATYDAANVSGQLMKDPGANGVPTRTSSGVTGPATAVELAAPTWVAGGGTAQAQTATYSPAVLSLTDGTRLCWKPTAANTAAAPTFSPNGLTAHTIVKAGGALVANDIITTAQACAVYNTTGTQWELQNPQTVASSSPTLYASAYIPPWGGINTGGNNAVLAVTNKVVCAEFLSPGLSITSVIVYAYLNGTDVGHYAWGFMDAGGTLIAGSTTVTGTSTQGLKTLTFAPVSLPPGATLACWTSDSVTTQFFATNEANYATAANFGLAGNAVKVFSCSNLSTTVSTTTTFPSTCGTRTALTGAQSYLPGSIWR